MYTSDIRRWTTFSMGSLPGRPPEAVESTFHGALDALRLGMSRWKPWGRKMWKSCHGENPFGKGQLVGFPHLSENRRLSLSFLTFLTQMPQHLVATFELFFLEPPIPREFRWLNNPGRAQQSPFGRSQSNRNTPISYVILWSKFMAQNNFWKDHWHINYETCELHMCPKYFRKESTWWFGVSHPQNVRWCFAQQWSTSGCRASEILQCGTLKQADEGGEEFPLVKIVWFGTVNLAIKH